MSGSTLDADLAELRTRLGNQPYENMVIGKMWAYHKDLVYQMWVYAKAKTEYGRRLSTIIIRERANGEKSAAVAANTAEMTDEVYEAHLAYRAAEQMVVADREALKILHAELDALRTQAADRRAADQFQARTQT